MFHSIQESRNSDRRPPVGSEHIDGQSEKPRIFIPVSQNFRSYYVFSKSKKLTLLLETYVEYSSDVEEKSRGFSRNYVDWFFKENIKYGRQSAMSETNIRGFALRPLICFLYRRVSPGLMIVTTSVFQQKVSESSNLTCQLASFFVTKTEEVS